TDDILVEGPRAQYVSYYLFELAGDIQHTNIELLIAAIALHIFAIVGYRLKGQNLEKTELTGKQENAVSTPGMKSGVGAYLIF
ncbi:cytochrome, partial [Pseudoalteromonas piscicida]